MNIGGYAQCEHEFSQDSSECIHCGNRPPIAYGVKLTNRGVIFWIDNQCFTLANTELTEDADCERDREFMARMMTIALNRLAVAK